jgi:alpha-ribazole phosphatase CobZ
MWLLLRKKGIRKKDLVKTALELFVPHPGVKDAKIAGEFLSKGFEDAFSDPNVNSLVLAGFCLEEKVKRGKIPGLGSFEDGPALVSDEILGMAIAEYIGGTRARFEYVRYDKEKPGILDKLGPFIDDVICGVIAGVCSKMYTELVDKCD